MAGELGGKKLKERAIRTLLANSNLVRPLTIDSRCERAGQTEGGRQEGASSKLLTLISLRKRRRQVEVEGEVVKERLRSQRADSLS